jgi:3-hydroxyisobutyrate dehydrogenase-like beta-hydroxyacid dehydrogenase
VDIGFHGLGAMGAGIVPRLMAAGHKVTGWNRTPEKANDLIKAGMLWANTPRAAAEAADIVFCIVTDAAAMRAVTLGPDGVVVGLRKGSIFIEMSTIAPDASRSVAAEFEKSDRSCSTHRSLAARSRSRKATPRSWSAATRRRSNAPSR